MNLFLILLATLPNAQATPCTLTGLQIMEKQDLQNKVSYESEVQKLTLKDLSSKNKHTKTRTIHRYQKNTTENKSLIAFMSPKDIRGTALLNWNHKKRENDQWLYLPELRMTRRIAGGTKKNYFMGTDFTYSDLEAEVLEDYKYNCLKIDKCGKKRKCFQVEALPKSETVMSRTGYSKRILSVDIKKFVIRKASFFDDKGKQIKILINRKFKKYNKDNKISYRPKKSIMTREGLHQTTIQTVERKVYNKIEDITFTERFILKGMHLK